MLLQECQGFRSQVRAAHDRGERPAVGFASEGCEIRALFRRRVRGMQFAPERFAWAECEVAIGLRRRINQSKNRLPAANECNVDCELTILFQEFLRAVQGIHKKKQAAAWWDIASRNLFFRDNGNVRHKLGKRRDYDVLRSMIGGGHGRAVGFVTDVGCRTIDVHDGCTGFLRRGDNR